MSAERPRPWHDPTPLPGFEPVWAGQFDTFNDWVNHATRALAAEFDVNGWPGHTAICIDALGRRCTCGGEFKRARDEGAFPIRYFFTGTVVKTPITDGMRAKFADLRPHVQDRLIKVLWHVVGTGRLNRADVMRIGRVSEPQASTDIGMIMARLPGFISYDRKLKTYVMTDDLGAA